jgi:thioredoxin-related protein
MLKNVMKKIFLLFLVIFSCQQVSNAQEKTNIINIHFDGKDYKNLELVIILDGGSKKRFAGQSENGIDWTFNYPDSMYNTHTSMRIEVPSNVDTITGNIRFKTITDNGFAGNYNFKQGISNIKAVFLKSGISNHILFRNDRNEVGFKNIHFDDYLVDSQSDQELLSSIEALVSGYSLIDRDNPNRLSYEDQLERYINLTKKYPDSYSLIYKLANTLNLYNSKSDVEKIYNCFSDKTKKAYWGEMIDDFINTIFSINTVLPVWDAERLEPIIQDTSKYNLIVFSASWCAPCHKLIPVLKEVYNNLTGKLDMVYVSLDEPKTVENWKILMKKEHIPWRSVLAVNDVRGITAKYAVKAIPHLLLVHPNGYSEIIDLTRKDDKEKLYRLVRQ